MDKWSEFKEEVRARTDLIALIGETRTVTPQNGGREYVTLCPFHDDHKPSMKIDPSRQTYYCFVCVDGGDCFSYVQKLEGLQFRDALEQLANRAGLEMPNNQQKSVKRATDRNTLLEALAWASRKFHECLLTDPAAEVARDYLLDRGFCEEIWSDFELGFHPGPWEWLMKSAKGHFSIQQLEEARLVVQQSNGQNYSDSFTVRNRIIFPIRNERGQVIAFGGRALPGSDNEKYGKYQNSKESYLFNKSKQLYGIEHARESMRDRKEVIVVEGYTDCISLHQVGIPNVVATLGTALTHEHVALIKRFCQNVILIFDGDTAGQKAANKALPLLLSHDIELKLLALPEGMDPPEYLEKHGVQEFQNLLQNAQEAWGFKLQQLAGEHNSNSAFASEKITEEMLALIAVAPGLQGTKREDLLLNRLANQVGLRGSQEQKLRSDLAKLRAKGPQVASSQHNNARSQPNDADVDFFHQQTNDLSGEEFNQVFQETSREVPQVSLREQIDQLLKPNLNRKTALERDLLEIIIMMPECITTVIQRETITIIRNKIVLELLSQCAEQNQRGEYTGADSLMSELEEPELKRFIMAITTEAEQKKITDKLQETLQDSEGNRIPFYLNQVIDQLNWEQRESQHRTTTRNVAISNHEPTSVDERMRQMLQDAAQFHQQRVTRNTASSQ